MQADYGWLFVVFTHPSNLVRFRLAGATPSPESFPQLVWSGVLTQFVVTTRESPAPIGLVSAYNPDYRHGFAYISAITDPRFTNQGWPLEALVLLVNHVFSCWNFRKLYFESIESNYVQFASGDGSIFSVESRLREHYFIGDRHEDFVTFAIYRDEWPWPDSLGALARARSAKTQGVELDSEQ